MLITRTPSCHTWGQLAHHTQAFGVELAHRCQKISGAYLRSPHAALHPAKLAPQLHALQRGMSAHDVRGEHDNASFRQGLLVSLGQRGGNATELRGLFLPPLGNLAQQTQIFQTDIEMRLQMPFFFFLSKLSFYNTKAILDSIVFCQPKWSIDFRINSSNVAPEKELGNQLF